MINDVILTTELLFRMSSNELSNWDLYRAGRENVENAVTILNAISTSDFSGYVADYDHLPITDKKTA
ncbi:hypothetical protein [Lentilactobacillus rapi]|uniref:hypothetical protein n=1 Tax=Lentilactobacillus rapi TaxID=481723 RepID=UPI003BF58558